MGGGGRIEVAICDRACELDRTARSPTSTTPQSTMVRGGGVWNGRGMAMVTVAGACDKEARARVMPRPRAMRVVLPSPPPPLDNECTQRRTYFGEGVYHAGMGAVGPGTAL